MMILASILCFLGLSFAESIQSPELYAKFEQQLKSPAGVEVEVHGADHQNGLYVISYRPDNFFDYVIISLQADYLSPQFQQVSQQLSTLRRHDQLLIKGDTNSMTGSYQNHVMVNDLQILKKFSSPYNTGDEYKHMTKVSQLVAGKDSLIVKVHASLVEGKVFVVEYGDANIPIVVNNNALTKDLYRGDKIAIRFTVQKYPSSPTHLKLIDTADGVRVLDAIVEQHEIPQDRCGELVMFPKSPQVKFNVFAMKVDIGDNLFRTYTLVNFNDVALFMALRDKMQVAWDANVSTSIRGRNYFINPKLKVCAKGTGNMQVPTQANPQILIDRVEDLTVEVLP